ncbi:hypothetical protein CANCADRAFT_3181 [Tortispora caseinolytica NRRL Y-17796]|uniref:Uncharacterized protein n=1 Tax=Tortispora caseinolytica NRRL Y-17796 TaxID=767744 RepID=A0A1E4T9W1_9ASCO|nr:hypothetical protein CANCADRAFT_3181 [Tortispora caseinolytica NRRL Y-17796]
MTVLSPKLKFHIGIPTQVDDTTYKWSTDDNLKLFILALARVPSDQAWIFFNTRHDLSWPVFYSRYVQIVSLKNAMESDNLTVSPPAAHIIAAYTTVAPFLSLPQYNAARQVSTPKLPALSASVPEPEPQDQLEYPAYVYAPPQKATPRYVADTARPVTSGSSMRRQTFVEPSNKSMYVAHTVAVSARAPESVSTKDESASSETFTPPKGEQFKSAVEQLHTPQLIDYDSFAVPRMMLASDTIVSTSSF